MPQKIVLTRRAGWERCILDIDRELGNIQTMTDFVFIVHERASCDKIDLYHG